MSARKKAMKQMTKKSVKPKINKSLKSPPQKKSKVLDKVVALKVPKLSSPKEPFKQSEFFNALAEQSNLSKKEVRAVLEGMQAIAKVHLVKNGPGSLVIPGLCKLTAVTKPATKARKGRNPFTGEEMTFKAKPARRVIKIKVIKKFKAELE